MTLKSKSLPTHKVRSKTPVSILWVQSSAHPQATAQSKFHSIRQSRLHPSLPPSTKHPKNSRSRRAACRPSRPLPTGKVNSNSSKLILLLVFQDALDLATSPPMVCGAAQTTSAHFKTSPELKSVCGTVVVVVRSVVSQVSELRKGVVFARVPPNQDTTALFSRLRNALSALNQSKEPSAQL